MKCPKCGNDTIVSAEYFGADQIIVEIVCWDEDCDFNVDKYIDVSSVVAGR